MLFLNRDIARPRREPLIGSGARGVECGAKRKGRISDSTDEFDELAFPSDANYLGDVGADSLASFARTVAGDGG